MLGAFDKQYKVIETRLPDDMTTLEFGELYDMINDPNEMTNLWNDGAFSVELTRLSAAIDTHAATILGW